MLQNYKIWKIVYGDVAVTLPKHVDMQLDLEDRNQVITTVSEVLNNYIYYKNVDKMLEKLKAC